MQKLKIEIAAPSCMPLALHVTLKLYRKRMIKVEETGERYVTSSSQSCVLSSWCCSRERYDRMFWTCCPIDKYSSPLPWKSKCLLYRSLPGTLPGGALNIVGHQAQMSLNLDAWTARMSTECPLLIVWESRRSMVFLFSAICVGDLSRPVISSTGDKCVRVYLWNPVWTVLKISPVMLWARKYF